MRKILALNSVVLIVFFICTLANAGDEYDHGDWEFNLAPFYLWAVSMDGDLKVMGNDAPLKADFSDIASNLEALFTVHFEGMHNSGMGLLVDVSYLNIGDQQTTPGPAMDVDFTSVMTEVAGMYRFDHGEHAFDLIGGIRYYSLEVEIDVVGVPPRIDGSQDWVDAMLGARYIWTITDKLNFMTRGDIGFGGSNFTWNLAGLFEYQPWKHVSLIAGYRYMDIDYDQGSGSDLFEYKVSMHGPLLGLNFVW